MAKLKSAQNEQAGGAAGKAASGAKAKRVKKGGALDNISEFYALLRLFAHLIRGGTTPVETITLMAQGASGIFKEPLEQVKQSIVVEGLSLSDGFANTGFFPSEFIAILRVGQSSGHLPTALEEYGKYLNGVITARRGFKAALKYPMLMLNALVIAVGAIIVLVVPGLKGSVASMIGDKPDVVLPIYTRILFGAYDALNVFGTPGVIVIITGLVWYLFFGPGRDHIMILVYKIPKVRKLNEKMRWAQWLIMSSICLKSGMTLAHMLVTMGQDELPKELSGKDVYKDICFNIKYGGRTLSEEFEKAGCSQRLVSLISIGEKKGYIDEILYSEGQDYMESIPFDIGEVKTTIESLLIAFVTIAGGAVMGSVMMTMFSLSNMVS